MAWALFFGLLNLKTKLRFQVTDENSMGERLVRRASDLNGGRKLVNVRAGTV